MSQEQPVRMWAGPTTREHLRGLPAGPPLRRPARAQPLTAAQWEAELAAWERASDEIGRDGEKLK